MILTPLANIASMPEGEEMQYIRGKVTKIADYNTGTSDAGKDWSFQKLTITDGKASVVVKAWNKDAAPTDWKGKTLHFTAEGKAKMKTKADTYRGTTTMLVNLSDTVNIDLAEPTGAPPVAAEPPPPAQTSLPPRNQAPAPAPAQSAPPPTQAKTNGVKTTPDQLKKEEEEKLAKVRKDVFRRSQLHAMCIACAHAEANQLKEQRGIQLSPDQISTAASSLFISCDRDRLHYDLPNHALDFTIKEKPTTPPATT